MIYRPHIDGDVFHQQNPHCHTMFLPNIKLPAQSYHDTVMWRQSCHKLQKFLKMKQWEWLTLIDNYKIVILITGNINYRTLVYIKLLTTILSITYSWQTALYRIEIVVCQAALSHQDYQDDVLASLSPAHNSNNAQLPLQQLHKHSKQECTM